MSTRIATKVSVLLLLFRPLLPDIPALFCPGRSPQYMPAYGFFAYVGAVNTAQRLQSFTFSSRMLSALRSDGGDIASCKEFAAGGSGSCRASDRLYKIAPAPFDPHFFSHGNLNMTMVRLSQLFTNRELAKRSANGSAPFLYQDSGRYGKPGTPRVFANLIVDFLRGRQRRPQRFSMTTRAGLAFSFASPSPLQLRQKCWAAWQSS